MDPIPFRGSRPGSHPMFDILLSHGRVVDGSGDGSLEADLGITGGRIAVIGDLGAAEARQRVDCAGKIVAPGFVDLHAHSELTLLANPAGESKLHQGVTTEVNGQCGLAPFPVRAEHREEMRSVCTFIDAPVEWTWEGVDEYLTALEAAQPSYNVAVLVGQSALRAWVMGFAARPATGEELREMCALLADSLRQGAVGLSLGLAYPLGSFADSEEPSRLAATCAEHDGLLTVHLRNEGPGLMESLDEMLGIAARTGCRLQIDHLKTIGRRHWGRAREVLAKIEAAASDGVDVAFDVYPYTAGSRHLYGSLPDWVVDGGIGPMLQRLKQSAVRERLRESLDAWAKGEDAAGGFSLDAANTMITSVQTEANEWCVGKRLDEIAEARGQDPLDAMLDLLIEEAGETSCVMWAMSEDDVQEFLKHPLGCIGTDGLAYAPYGPLSKGAPHPRCYGTFARFLGHYVRDAGLLPLPEAVRKCTSLPASRLKLADRGLLSESCRADVVVFDPATIAERGEYGSPHAYPDGIETVVVNGQLAVAEGETCAARAGMVLRGP
jgi:N-acyl-D-amino-acid deacylase